MNKRKKLDLNERSGEKENDKHRQKGLIHKRNKRDEF